jgi:hypothetical protein
VNTWVFQANPDIYRVDAALKAFSEHHWLVNQHAKHIVTGDEVFIYRCGENAAIVAVGTVLCDPALLVVPPEEQKYEVEPLKFDGPRMRVRVRTRRIDPAVPRFQLLKDPDLGSVAVFKGCTGTNFAIPAGAVAAIHRILDTHVSGG